MTNSVETILALTNRPNNIAIMAFGFGIPNRCAAIQPVHAPVIGNGIPTKRTSPQKWNFSIIAPRFLVRLRIHVKNRSPNLHLLKNVIDGPKRLIMGMVTKKLPTIEEINTKMSGMSVKKYAHGIDPLNSVIGSIANMNVAISGLFEIYSMYGINVSAINYLKLIL